MSASPLHRARRLAFGIGEYVGQESFMSASEILGLAAAIGTAPGDLVLDVCCGRGGAALHVARHTGCRIVGVDHSSEAIRAARGAATRAGVGDRASFVIGDATRLPLAGDFDVALLYETALAIEDKLALLGEVRRVLRPGGQFGLTLEVGEPLSPTERTSMPEGDEIWLIPAGAFLALARQAELSPQPVEDHTEAHACNAARLLAQFGRARNAICAEIGRETYDATIAAHRKWVEWLSAGRVRKLAVILKRPD